MCLSTCSCSAWMARIVMEYACVRVCVCAYMYAYVCVCVCVGGGGGCVPMHMHTHFHGCASVHGLLNLA